MHIRPLEFALNDIKFCGNDMGAYRVKPIDLLSVPFLNRNISSFVKLRSENNHVKYTKSYIIHMHLDVIVKVASS